jgi:hypothetical protein
MIPKKPRVATTTRSLPEILKSLSMRGQTSGVLRERNNSLHQFDRAGSTIRLSPSLRWRLGIWDVVQTIEDLLAKMAEELRQKLFTKRDKNTWITIKFGKPLDIALGDAIAVEISCPVKMG